ncbi:hypothetical protein L0Z66_08670 [Phaeobacter sp. BS34]
MQNEPQIGVLVGGHGNADHHNCGAGISAHGVNRNDYAAEHSSASDRVYPP